MFRRHDLCDDHWDRIRHLRPGQVGGREAEAAAEGGEEHAAADIVQVFVAGAEGHGRHRER